MNAEFITLDKSLVYENPWMQVYEHKILRRGQPGVYGVVCREHSVIVVPLTPSAKTLLLKQFRYPTNEDSWELPMGGICGAESPHEAARRELLEESGLVASSLTQIGCYRAVPGLTPQEVTVFVAEMSEDSLISMAAPAAADDIQAGKVVTLSEVWALVMDGTITDGFTLVALLYVKLYLASR